VDKSVITSCLEVSLGCLWSPRANAVSLPAAAVPSIRGVVVDAAAPSGTSETVINPLSFVRCEVFVGTLNSAEPLEIVPAVCLPAVVLICVIVPVLVVYPLASTHALILLQK
jgi:hypothetical protein